MNRGPRTEAVLRPPRHGTAPVVALGDARRGMHQAIADGIPALPVWHRLHENASAPGLVERAQVGVEIAAVVFGPASGIDPGGVLVRAQRQALREDRDPPSARGGGV